MLKVIHSRVHALLAASAVKPSTDTREDGDNRKEGTHSTFNCAQDNEKQVQELQIWLHVQVKTINTD